MQLCHEGSTCDELAWTGYKGLSGDDLGKYLVRLRSSHGQEQYLGAVSCRPDYKTGTPQRTPKRTHFPVQPDQWTGQDHASESRVRNSLHLCAPSTATRLQKLWASSIILLRRIPAHTTHGRGRDFRSC
jgi:hypothetical protein